MASKGKQHPELARFQTGEPTATGQQPVTIKFRRTVQYECDGRHKGPFLRKGETFTFDYDFAQRWIKRGAAYDVAGPEPVDAEPVKPKPGVLQKGGASQGIEDYEAPQNEEGPRGLGYELGRKD